ncbi:MAG: hypothetical protein Q8885_01490 [Candidatus Phytoplasma stylosanthis]|nr:hypothetical protein [Candidatus Phytoplasma stylosanthis]
MDAAKVQYEKLFQKYIAYLNDNGIVICDNLNFHNLDINDPKLSRSAKRLINKINDFKFFLQNNYYFTTFFLNIGDGLSFLLIKCLTYKTPTKCIYYCLILCRN